MAATAPHRTPLTFAGRHTCTDPGWYTPRPYVEAARMVMGAIDLDPASDAEANQIVRATRFHTIDDNGLKQPWFGRVFLNPPGGKNDEDNANVPAFWLKLLASLASSVDAVDLAYPTHVTQAVWIGYSLEQLQTLQQVGADRTPLDCVMCVPAQRIAFVENAAKRAARIERLIREGEAPGASARKQKTAADCRAGRPPKDAPSHANYITYIGDRVDIFRRVFSAFGKVK